MSNLTSAREKFTSIIKRLRDVISTHIEMKYKKLREKIFMIFDTIFFVENKNMFLIISSLWNETCEII